MPRWDGAVSKSVYSVGAQRSLRGQCVVLLCRKRQVGVFSGDYTEDAQVYVCDPIRNQHADLAVLDCAYGRDETPYDAACDRLVQKTEELLSTHKLLLFPVPKFGRGLEILKLFSARLSSVPYYADALFCKTLRSRTQAASGTGQ